MLVPTLPRYGVAAAAWVGVVRSAVPTVLLLPGLGSLRRPRFRSWATGEAWRRIKPLLLGMSYYKTDPLVDRFLSSMAPSGGLTLLNLAQQAWGAITQILNRAISGPLVPTLARSASSGNWPLFQRLYRTRLLWVTALTAAAFAVLVTAGPWLLEAVVGHGGVTRNNVHALWWLMVALGGVLVGGAAGQIVSSSFYALGNTTTPTTIGVLGFTLGIVLKGAGFLTLGVVGIAVGASAYYVLNVVVLFVLLEKRIGNDAAR